MNRYHDIEIEEGTVTHISSLSPLLNLSATLAGTDFTIKVSVNEPE